MIEDFKPPFIEYRIYYNEAGTITACAMVQHPEGDNYIVVTREQYENYFRYNVRNGKLVPIRIETNVPNILCPSNDGYRVVKGHVNLLLGQEEEWKDIQYYDWNN